MAKSAKELTLEWHERVWNQRDESAIHELMSDHCMIHGLNLDAPGPAVFGEFYRRYMKLFDKLHIDLVELVESGDLVVGHARMTGTHHASGNPIDTIFSLSVKWKNGKAVEARNVVDNAAVLMQMGVLDAKTITSAFTPG